MEALARDMRLTHLLGIDSCTLSPSHLAVCWRAARGRGGVPFILNAYCTPSGACWPTSGDYTKKDSHRGDSSLPTLFLGFWFYFLLS